MQIVSRKRLVCSASNSLHPSSYYGIPWAYLGHRLAAHAIWWWEIASFKVYVLSLALVAVGMAQCASISWSIDLLQVYNGVSLACCVFTSTPTTCPHWYCSGIWLYIHVYTRLQGGPRMLEALIIHHFSFRRLFVLGQFGLAVPCFLDFFKSSLSQAAVHY